MSKICPKCRCQQTDERLISCVKCHAVFVDEKEMVGNLTKDELKYIATCLLKDWRVFIGVTVLIVVGVCVSYWKLKDQITSQITNFQSTTSNQVVVAYAEATNQMGVQFARFSKDASNQIASAYSSVTNQVAVEFQTPRVRQTVESVAKGEAKSILENEVRPIVSEFRDDASFIRTVARAQAYDFKSYRELLKMQNGTNEMSYIARQVLASIDRSLDRDRVDTMPHRVLSENRGTNSYAGPFTTDELILDYNMGIQHMQVFTREGFANAAAGKHNKLLLPLLMELLIEETDLDVADRLIIAISELANQEFHARDIERIQLWWSENKSAYPAWPRTSLTQGVLKFSKTDYSSAADEFEAITKVDPDADMSRAYEIACFAETRNTNQITLLEKGFKDPSNRWAQWARAKVELDFGSVSNATVLFYKIQTNFPTMYEKANPNSHMYRRIDWALFNKLSAKTN